MKVWIEVEIGRNVGQQYDLTALKDGKERAMIGRDPLCLVRLHDTECSRRHAEIWLDGGQYFIQDLNSRNGTRLNGKRVKAKTELKGGDTIDVGIHRLVFCVERKAAKAAKKAETAEPPAKGSVLKPLTATLTRESMLHNVDVDKESDPHLGSVFAGGYQIVERISKSEKSLVYKGLDISSQQPVAIKIVRPGVEFSESEKARFIRGAKQGAAIKSRNVVRILRGGNHSGLFYIVMEFVEGQCLRDVLEENAYGLSPKVVVNMGLQLAGVLTATTALRIVHRHICPDNILIGKDGVLRLTDFDLLKTYEPDEGGSNDVTSSVDRVLIGDLLYAAPEMLTRPVDVDFRADIYSVGAVLYHCATGVPAFGDVPQQEVLQRVLNNELLAPEKLKPSVPAELSAVIMRAMKPSPDDRYPSAADMVADLQRAKNAV